MEAWVGTAGEGRGGVVGDWVVRGWVEAQWVTGRRLEGWRVGRQSPARAWEWAGRRWLGSWLVERQLLGRYPVVRVSVLEKLVVRR